ncbi:glycoside hydrolase family 16 protein [Prevotella histicola]|uniref:glycoside hydrolase family 16 protein n=1 Tax=Prevotella histicola TaxID=470565 RepID=UPI00241D1A4D|nr:glycoside hydrolase family 16 protein [Prevotella histicola]
MSRKKRNKQMLAMVLIALFVAVSSAQAVSFSGGGELCVTESATSRSEYVLVFSDEFNKPDGTLPDPEVWTPCVCRPKVTWARFLSNSPKVAFIQDGNLVLRAIPNPDRLTDDVDMLTGGINSSQKFVFRYGRVECRALVNPFIGNFPAIWMMPKTALAWPKGGEIDIFEQINTEQKAYSTVHSAWTKSHPDETHSGNVNLPMNRYHVYALEWEKDVLTFFADGKQVYQYKKQNDSLEQWPFDKSDFYLILNQSVGDGAWAKMPDVMHTYEMRIDWIRVYQKK